MYPILQVKGLKKYFPIKLSFFDSIRGKQTQYVKAVDGVDFTIDETKTLALVGESGCGKTTVGKMVTRLIDPTEGSIVLKDIDVATLKGEDLKAYRKEVQMVYQDPFASINPRFRIYDVLEEPLLIHGIGSLYMRERSSFSELWKKLKLHLQKIIYIDTHICSREVRDREYHLQEPRSSGPVLSLQMSPFQCSMFL